MSYIIPGRLPSLACPLIVNPAEGVDNNKVSVPRRPPFPEIDLITWDGFTMHHLRWIGVKTPNHLPLDDQAISDLIMSQGPSSYRINLAIRHELCHHRLGLTPFSLVMKFTIMRLYTEIYHRIMSISLKDGRGQECIEVPLTLYLFGNELQKQWAWLVRLHKASEPVQEIYAVQSSLLESQDLFKKAGSWVNAVYTYMQRY